VQTASRAPLWLCRFRVFDRKKTRTKAERIGRVIVVRSMRAIESTGRNIWCPPWGTIKIFVPFKSIKRRFVNMRNTRQGSVAPNGGESITMQQIMETMHALQETVATSIMDQKRIQVDMVAS